MINEIFQSLHEAVKKRNKPEDFAPLEINPGKDVIHRGWLKKSIYPIRYDMIPNGKTNNTGKHIYNFKSGGAAGFMEIDHEYRPLPSGHETHSTINFELEGRPPEEDIQIYRSFILPSFMHHINSHRPDIINFTSGVMNADDLIRRMGSEFVIDNTGSSLSVKRVIDPKIIRLISHLKNGGNDAIRRTR